LGADAGNGALQALKQSIARTLALRGAEPFWQARYYDFNVWTEGKRIEKLRYMHRNPLRAVSSPAQKTGRGAVTNTTSPESKVSSRSSQSGQRGVANRSGS
jgi:hypothetical protein